MRRGANEGRRTTAIARGGRGWAIGTAALAAGLTAATTGCLTYEDDGLTREARQRLLVADEPAGPLSIAEARHEVAEHGAGEIVLVGRVGGVADPFLVDQAGFFITPVPGAPAAPAHDPHEDEAHGTKADTAAKPEEAGHDHGHEGHAHGEKPATKPADHDHAGHDHAEHGHEGHDHSAHDPSDAKHAETCPFCKRNRDGDKDVVLVQLTDAAGKMMAGDPRVLLGLAEGQVVVVEGHPRMDGPNLYVKADKIFVRK